MSLELINAQSRATKAEAKTILAEARIVNLEAKLLLLNSELDTMRRMLEETQKDRSNIFDRLNVVLEERDEAIRDESVAVLNLHRLNQRTIKLSVENHALKAENKKLVNNAEKTT